MIKRQSLSFRIITRVLAITVILFVVTLTGYYYYTRNLIRESTSSYAIELAGNIVGRIEEVLQPLEKIPQMVAATLEMELFPQDSLFSALRTIVERNPDIYGTCIAFEPYFSPEKGQYQMLYAYRDSDTVRSISLGSEEYDYFYMDWYQIPAMLKTPYWSEPYYDEGAGNILMATYSVPFYCLRDGERRFAGIITVDLELEWLTDIVSEVKIFETGYAFLISRNGVTITHPDKSYIMNSSIFSISEDWDAPILREIGRELYRGKRNFRKYNIPGRDDRWIYYRNLNSNLWSISVVYPDSEMYAPLRHMLTLLIFLIAAGLMLLTIIIGGIVNRLATPLAQFAASARTVAEGNFNVQLPPVKSRDEMLELHNAFSHMQSELSRYVENLKETTVAKEKIESELRIAREIQMSMIPHSFPPFPDLPEVSVFAILKSAKEVGGDLYDFFFKGNSYFCFAIGDVSGKGVPASLFMAVTRTLLRSIADKETNASAILNSLNKSLALNNDSCMFVTFFLGILNLKTGHLQYANAGHNPPLLVRAGGETETFEVKPSIPLGLLEEFSYPELKIQLSEGDKIFLYTDGISEAENASLELFGEMAIADVVVQNHTANPREMISHMESALEKHVAGYMQSDDITMMTIQYNG